MGDELSEVDISELAEQTQLVYERNARRFASERSRVLFEKPWIDRFLELIPARADLLDLGCGAGEPIASYLLGRGNRVVGLDASKNMLRLARENIPAGEWILGDMRDFQLGEFFHGIIAWNSFFHLTRDEQRTALPCIAKHLSANGALLLTVGPNDGEVAGHVGSDSVYHASLSQNEYGDILANHGLEIERFVVEDPDCDGASVVLARKSPK